MCVYSLVSDTHALPAGYATLPTITDENGATLALKYTTTLESDWYVNYQLRDDWSYQIDQVACFTTFGSYSEWYLLTLWLRNTANNTSAWVDIVYLENIASNIDAISYIVHNENTPSWPYESWQFHGEESLFENSQQIWYSLFPSNPSSGWDVPWVAYICPRVIYILQVSWHLDLSGIVTYYYSINWTFLRSVKEILPPVLVSESVAAIRFFVWQNYNDIKQWYWGSGSAQSLTNFQTWRLYDWNITGTMVWEFFSSTGATDNVWIPTIPSILSLSSIENDWWTWNILDPEEPVDYFVDCSSYLDVWCYISWFWDWITDKISSFFDWLFPTINFSGWTNTCYVEWENEWFTGTGYAIGYLQKVANIFALVIPLPPEEWEQICTFDWLQTMEYRREYVGSYFWMVKTENPDEFNWLDKLLLLTFSVITAIYIYSITHRHHD